MVNSLPLFGGTSRSQDKSVLLDVPEYGLHTLLSRGRPFGRGLEVSLSVIVTTRFTPPLPTRLPPELRLGRGKSR